MYKSYLEVKGADRTAWYESKTIKNIGDGAALLNKAIDTAPDPDISTLEMCAKDELQPITQEEYTKAVRSLVSGEIHGLITEIDLVEDHASFTYLSIPERPLMVSGMVSRIAGIYAMSINKATGKLDDWALTYGVMEHCHWDYLSSPAKHFGVQTQKPPTESGMTMA